MKPHVTPVFVELFCFRGFYFYPGRVQFAHNENRGKKKLRIFFVKLLTLFSLTDSCFFYKCKIFVHFTTLSVVTVLPQRLHAWYFHRTAVKQDGVWYFAGQARLFGGQKPLFCFAFLLPLLQLILQHFKPQVNLGVKVNWINFSAGNVYIFLCYASHRMHACRI